jgi:hypothetical protein
LAQALQNLNPLKETGLWSWSCTPSKC